MRWFRRSYFFSSILMQEPDRLVEDFRLWFNTLKNPDGMAMLGNLNMRPLSLDMFIGIPTPRVAQALISRYNLEHSDQPPPSRALLIAGDNGLPYPSVGFSGAGPGQELLTVLINGNLGSPGTAPENVWQGGKFSAETGHQPFLASSPEDEAGQDGLV